MSHPAKRLVSLAAIAALAIGACSASTTPAPSAGAPSTGASGAPSTAAGAGPTCVAGSITASGSTALQPLVDAAGKKYVAACTGATVTVQGGGSGHRPHPGPPGRRPDRRLGRHRRLEAQARRGRQLVDHVVARQGWVMVINKGVTGVTNLTTAAGDRHLDRQDHQLEGRRRQRRSRSS